MNINLPQTAADLLLNIINIIILFVVVKALVYKPVKKFLDNRNARVTEETGKAERMLDEANATLSQKDKLLNEGIKKGEEEAGKIIAEARENSRNIVDNAKKNATEIEEKALREAKEEKDKFIASSRDEIAELAVKIAERILKRETSKEDNEKIVKEFFEGGEL